MKKIDYLMIAVCLLLTILITAFADKDTRELEQQIEKMKCCGNCIHCKYDENEESYEFCEKHQQVVNIAIVPCSEWKGR